MRGNKETCPVCGALSDVPDGIYRFGDEVLRALNTASQEDVSRFKDAVEAVAAGTTSIDAATAELASTNATLSELLKSTKGNHELITVLLALLTFFLTIYGLWDSNQADAQAHDDAVRIEQAIERQTKAIQSAEQADQSVQEAQRKLDEQIQRLNELTEETPRTQPTTKPTQPPAQLKSPSRMTRQQRRATEKPWKKRR
jgi:prefoldin subunit 5